MFDNSLECGILFQMKNIVPNGLNDHKSFLKWAGGKIKLLPKLRELGIECGKRYIEPFVGSGVVALNMPHQEIIIGDTNEGLIDLWNELATDGKACLKDCLEVFKTPHTEDIYYHFRDVFNHTLNPHIKAYLFLYLNKHCFNGLCRCNAKGEFNVPYNHGKTPPACPEKELLHAIEVSKRMTIYNCKFAVTFIHAQTGDMIYCDPPYLPLKASSFVDYSADGFNLDSHKDLVNCALAAQKLGATVIISNNNTPTARKLYENATETHFIDVQKNINCKANGRKKQSEIIAVYRP